MKHLLKKVIQSMGYELRKTKVPQANNIGTDQRPVGSMQFLLEDLKKRGLRCDSILDVGANKTRWSRMAKEIYPNAKFCLIEPQSEMQKYLEEFCKQYVDSHYILAGAGAKPETLTLTVWDDLAGSSFLPKQDQNLKKIGKQRDIQIITIDQLLQTSKITPPQLIKLDIQGFELEALKGAENTFGTTEVYILEVSLFQFGDVLETPLLADVVNFMIERNYVVYDFPGFLRRPFDGALGQCDICFVKKNGFLRASNSWI